MTANAPNNAHAAGKGRSFLTHYFPYHFLLVLGISLFVAWFEDSRIVSEMQNWSLDWFLNHRPPTPPANFEDVYLVHIADADYRDPKMFNAQSPLKPELVVDLISAVSSLRPKIVGVDLDTKDSPWYSAVAQNCLGQNGALRVVPPSKPEVVWARMPVESRTRQADLRAEKPIQLYQLLGGFKDCEQALYGIPRFPLDADGVVREYVGEFEVDPQQKKPSFARAIAEDYDRVYQSSRKERILNFAAARPKGAADPEQLCAVAPASAISAEQLFCALPAQAANCHEEKEARSKGDQESAARWIASVPDKIVLIGGAFEDARDAYPTPIGQMCGVDLNALAIESDLHPGAIHPTPLLCGLAGDLLAGTIVVWIFWFVRSPTWALVLGTLGFGALSLLVSAALFYFLATWLSVIPVLAGVNIHQYCEHLRTTWKAGNHAG
jgi:CHASE2 domain-containing sensor protein